MLRSQKQANIRTAVHYTQENVITERCYLSHMARSHGLAGSITLDRFRRQTGLADLYWHALYFKVPGRDDDFRAYLADVDGFVFFMHGWTGSHRIWENLPVKLTGKHKNILVFNLDVNGFGQSPFLNSTPSAEQCSPPALMKSIELWLEAIGLWPPLVNRTRRPFYLFVGHSMSGAALFFKDTTGWANQPYALYALAPALFHNDAQRKAFFKTMGVSIGLPSFNTVKDALASRVIDLFGPGASPQVKNEHLRIYNQTPFGTLAQTLYLLGVTTDPPRRRDWHRFRVALGHKDRIVGMDNVLELLQGFNFKPSQIRLMQGDHYFFSYGEDSPPQHQANQKTIFNDLLRLCYELTREAGSR